MNPRQQEAVDLFFSGCNCCQAVAAMFCADYGIPRETVLRLGSTFGGGMRKKEVCGAACGGLMALGMKYGMSAPGDKEQKEESNAKTIAFMEAFAERFGSYLCRDLLLEGQYWRDVCGKYVAESVTIAEELGA